MMRAPTQWAVACRRPDGSIITQRNELPNLSGKSRWRKVPFVRGVLVLVESRDPRHRWATVGVSENIIEASWIALVDSVEYKLVKDGTAPPATAASSLPAAKLGGG